MRWIVFSLLAALFVVGFLLYREAQRNAVYSCVASVNQELQENQPVISVPEQEWFTLERSVSDALIRGLKHGDCGRTFHWEMNGAGEQFVDPWGNPLSIKVKADKDGGRFLFYVWSLGQDGVSGTSDDLGPSLVVPDPQ